MKISIGNDHGGYDLSLHVIKHLQATPVEIFYYGTFSASPSVDYPDYARRVAMDIVSGKSEFGILICRSGVGMCIAANKLPKIRAVNCYSADIAKRAREHNDANVLCLGAEFVTYRKAKVIIDTFLQTKFAGDRHMQRLDKITKLETADEGME